MEVFNKKRDDRKMVMSPLENVTIAVSVSHSPHRTPWEAGKGDRTGFFDGIQQIILRKL
jgi:hypothetical protein